MDENQYHITEDFINRSWNNMRVMLDQEIPVQRRKPLWLFFLIATILAGSFGYLVWQGIQTEDLSPVKTIHLLKESELPGESTDFVSQQSSGELEETNAYVGDPENNASEIISEEANLKSSKNIIGTKAQALDLNIDPEIVKGSFNQKNAVALTDNNTGHEGGNDLLIKTNALEDESIGPDISGVSEFIHSSEMPGFKHRVLISIDFLPMLQLSMFNLNYINLLPAPNMSMLSNTEILQKELPKSVFDFGVYTAVLSNEFISAQGFDLGISGNWYIKNSWRISSTIGYQQFQYTSAEEDLLDAGAGFEMNMDTTIFSSASMLDYNSANNLIRKTSHIHTQLGLGYELRRSLWLTGAFRVSKLLKATNEELFITSSALEQNQLNIGSSYLKDNGFTDSWDIGLLVGIEWQLHRNIALATQYHYGLDPILRKESFSQRVTNTANTTTNYQRFVRLGLNIYFR